MSREQGRTAPAHARHQFAEGIRSGWITLHRPALAPPVARVMDEIVGLSPTDAELLVICTEERLDLFTDENLLSRAAEKRGIEVYDVVDAIMMLVELGDLDTNGAKKLILDIHLEDGRRFTQSELAGLGLQGLL
ncbi:MAG: hypothetical protein HY556_04990 [Euryarchaeota archaeon]|nr:hypothetical protein [Euryarchaeota archaeon]